ncbi:hypothetical protein M433DRAFT_63402 [Acidomyces richmondensis BFW]|nr:MAG: hypothetical protein FE78DRAFT_142667 [Acidomyces sp. 'richmondensis']KYG47301.1 hypothetical protein M433DRAFT_63402 [Acidomyces richmondensis BFW]
MADQLPSIDFGFNDLRERMAQFTMRFDEFIERGRKRVLDERNAFRMSLAELEESERNRRQAIANLELKATSHAQTRAKEAAETAEMHAAIRSLTQQRDEHLAQRDNLKAEIVLIQGSIRQRKELQAAYQRSLDAQARHNMPELRFWEHCLGLRIEGTGVDDQLRFVYACVDEREPEKEVWFELNMSGRDFEVVDTKPRLEKESVEEVQNRLHDTKELGAFLKSMRNLFLRALKT